MGDPYLCVSWVATEPRTIDQDARLKVVARAFAFIHFLASKGLAIVP